MRTTHSLYGSFWCVQSWPYNQDVLKLNCVFQHKIPIIVLNYHRSDYFWKEGWKCYPRSTQAFLPGHFLSSVKQTWGWFVWTHVIKAHPGDICILWVLDASQYFNCRGMSAHIHCSIANWPTPPLTSTSNFQK